MAFFTAVFLSVLTTPGSGSGCDGCDAAALLQHRRHGGARGGARGGLALALAGGGFKAQAAYAGILPALMNATESLEELMQSVEVSRLQKL